MKTCIEEYFHILLLVYTYFLNVDYKI